MPQCTLEVAVRGTTTAFALQQAYHDPGHNNRDQHQGQIGVFFLGGLSMVGCLVWLAPVGPGWWVGWFWVVGWFWFAGGCKGKNYTAEFGKDIRRLIESHDPVEPSMETMLN